jgi:tetratricopeptide (TPR) repeat protein
VVQLAALIGATSMLGCATARPAPARPDDAPALAAADARVLAGCYDCLLEARATYARLADGPMAAVALPRLFETDVLLALREKELALDGRPTVERARALLPRLPVELQGARVLRMVDAVLPDPDGTPLHVIAGHRRRNLPMLADMDGEVAWLATSGYTPAAREYVALALECSNGRRPAARRGARGTLQAPAVPDPPLVAYRASFCARVDTAALRRLQDAVPEFVEASYYRGQSATAGAIESGGEEARAHFEAAYARFPQAPGVTFAYGWLETVLGDCEAAVPRYAETVAREPGHERAWRQFTICLSALHQDSATVEAATRLIGLRSAHSDDGYYWRALSRLRLGQLPLARGDIDTAKVRSRAANVLTLAGVIEHDQGDLPIAERDLREALAAPSGPANCTAASYLARVLTRVERWRESASYFETGMGCFDQKVAQLRTRLEELTATPAETPAIAEARAARGEAGRRQHGPSAQLPHVGLQRGQHARARRRVRARARAAGDRGARSRARRGRGEAARRDGEGADRVARRRGAALTPSSGAPARRAGGDDRPSAAHGERWTLRRWTLRRWTLRAYSLCVESRRLVSELEIPLISRTRRSASSNASRLSVASSATMSQRPLVVCSARTSG